MFWIIPLVLLLLSLATIVWILVRKAPQVRVVNVDVIPDERMRRTKEALLVQRVERFSAEKLGGVAKVSKVLAKNASRVGRRAVQKLYKLEQHYQKLRQAPHEAGMIDADVARRMIDQAAELVREEEYIPAEKLYIELISRNPKMAEAYEGLGNLYLENRQYAQARETFGFTLKLSPDDASVYMSLADLSRAEGDLKKSFEAVKKAVELRPNNPKYLDAYIETALEVGDKEEAKKGVARMKEANPENQKIQDWEEQLQESGTSSQS